MCRYLCSTSKTTEQIKKSDKYMISKYDFWDIQDTLQDVGQYFNFQDNPGISRMVGHPTSVYYAVTIILYDGSDSCL
jgi:hypothetical protein